MLLQPGDAFDADRLDRSLKSLYATGLFRDVRIGRDGGRVVVEVAENPIVNRVAFEGNRKISDDVLRNEAQLRARSVFTPQAAQADRQRILELYARRGRFGAVVEPKIIELEQNRVDVVYEIQENEAALVARINFVGNRAYSDSRLKEVVATKEQAWYRIFSSSDQFDPERLAFDRELLRRFYLRSGYADVQVTGATAELAPDRTRLLRHLRAGRGRPLPRRPGGGRVQHPQPRRRGPARPGPGRGGRLVRRRRGGARLAVAPGRGQPPRLPLRGRAAAHPARPREPPRRPHLRGERGAARLRRAHRHRRQHPHPGPGDPARVPHRRGRRLQRRADPPLAPAHPRPRLLLRRAGDVLARLRAGPRGAEHPGGGARDRRGLARRRLLDGRGRARRRGPARAQPARHRHRRAHQRHARAAAEPGGHLDHRSGLPRPQPRRRRRPLLHPAQPDHDRQLPRAPRRLRGARRLRLQRAAAPDLGLHPHQPRRSSTSRRTPRNSSRNSRATRSCRRSARPSPTTSAIPSSTRAAAA